MAIANLIGAGIGAILPIVMEAMRDKPDPEIAKSMLRSQRQARIEQNIGAGMSMQQAEKQVDAQLEQEFKAADEAGEFNTPWGEMVAGAVLGGAVPWAAGKVAGMAKGAGAAAKAATGGVDDAAAAAAKTGPSPLDVQNAMTGGIGGQFPTKSAPRMANPMLKGDPQADMSTMLVGGPFPGAQAEIPLTMGKAVKPTSASNVDVMAMLGGGPFPG